MQKVIPSTPRINRAQEIARGFLLCHKITSLPINVEQLIKNTGFCVLKKYSKQMQKRDLTYDYLCDNFGKDGVTLFNPSNKKPYTILYNDYRKPYARIRWTLAHELGHVILRHNSNFEETKLSRSGLTDAAYKVLDDEADAFAAELLSPAIVLIAAGWTSKNDIVKHCALSNDAAKYRSKSVLGIEKVKERYFTYEDHLFKAFYKHIYLNYCPECKTYFISKEAEYCPICGTNHLIWKEGTENIMKYPGIEVDENSKALSCPKCSNEELSYGDHCIICGIKLVNKCIRKAEIENGYKEYYDGCSKLLPGNARYCPYCGGESSFYFDGLLPSWEKYIKTNERKANDNQSSPQPVSQNPFDKEIPF